MADPADDEIECEEGYGEGVWGDGGEEAEEVEEEVVCMTNDPEDEVQAQAEVEYEEQYTEEAAEEEPAESETVSRKSRPSGGDYYTGLVHRVGPKTGNMLIKSRLVSEKYGMEAMILKGNNPAGAQLCDRVKFSVLERDGQRPLAASVKVIGKVDKILPDKGKGKGKDKGEGKGKSKSKSKSHQASASSSSAAEIAFAGVVSSQSSEQPYAYLIDCDNVTAAFGLDAWFNPAEKPANVSVGSMVAFTVSPNGHAQWVCKLAPLGDNLWEAQAAAAERKGPPVRKAINKRA